MPSTVNGDWPLDTHGRDKIAVHRYSLYSELEIYGESEASPITRVASYNEGLSLHITNPLHHDSRYRTLHSLQAGRTTQRLLNQRGSCACPTS